MDAAHFRPFCKCSAGSAYCLGGLKDGKAVVSKTLRMDVYDSGGFPAGQCDFIFLCQLRRACNVFDGHYLLFLGKGVQRGMELDHVCGIGRWNGNLFLVVLQCVWIYSDDVFLLCGNDADGPVETGQRTMERNDPKRSFYFGDRLCHCSVVVYSKSYSLWRRFSGTPGIERKRGTVCKIPVQAVAHQDLPEKRRLHVAYDLL